MKMTPTEAPRLPLAEAHAPPPGLRPPLAPLLAGARARGVADGLEWLGLAAILLDDRGESLHVTTGACEWLGAALYVEAGRLRARDAAVDAELTAAIRNAVEEGIAGVAAVPADPESGRDALVVRISCLDSIVDDPYQLLRAVAVLETGDAGAPDGPSRRH